MSKPSLPPHPTNFFQDAARACLAYDRDSHQRRRRLSDPASFLSGDAVSDRRLITALLDVMEWDRVYDAFALHSMFPTTSMDSLREALHALWIDRRIERAGVSGWRRQESRCAGLPAALVGSTL
jgi:hypothetical protein